MGAAEQQKFSQYPYQYGDGLRGAALAQTRNGKDELITPIAFWELDAATGLYLPPGMSSNPRKPRVEATLTGSLVTHLVTDVNLGTLSAGSTTWIYTSTAPTIPFRLLRGYAFSSTAVKIELILQLHRNAIFSGSALLNVVFNNAATSPWVVVGETDVLRSRFWRVGIRNAGEADASLISNGLYGVI